MHGNENNQQLLLQILTNVRKDLMNVMNSVIILMVATHAAVLDQAIDFTVMEQLVKVIKHH